MPCATRPVLLLAGALLAGAAGCAHVPGGDAGVPPEPGAPPAPTETPSATGAESAPPAPAPPPAPRPAPATTPPPVRPDPAAAARIDAIRAGVDDFLRMQGLLLWNVWTRGAAPDLEPSLTAHAGLFTLESVLLVRKARDAATGEERRALGLLHSFLVGEFLGRAVDGAHGEPSGRSVVWDGQPISTSRIPSLLATEPSAARRTALEHAWAEAERTATPRAAARWDTIAGAARALGYPSLVAAAADLRGDSAVALAGLAERVLATTDSTYRALMEAMARAELNQAWADVRGRDLPRLLHTEERRSLVPISHAASSARSTFGAIGMGLTSMGGLAIDDQERPGKDPRALTIPVAVPGDVRVSYVAGDGAADLRGMLHELGAATYFAMIRTPSVEFRRLGPVTVGTWAHLFGDLVGDPAWVTDRTGRPDANRGPLARAAAARRLHRARILAAHVLDELARDRPAGRAVATSRRLLERTLMRAADDDEVQLFVADRDPLLESADELRSMLLAANADAFLARRAKGPWWRSADAGTWLGAVYAEGSRLSPIELARKMGVEQIDASALLASTRARLDAAGVRLSP